MWEFLLAAIVLQMVCQSISKDVVLFGAFLSYQGLSDLLKECLVATGASARYLGMESEQALRGKGVSACATCDGAFFRDSTLAVIGGGDSAVEEGIFLTKFASEVVLIHRRDEFRGSRIMQNRAKNHEKISIEYNTQVTDVLGEDKIEALELTDTMTGEKRQMDIEGLFIAIGHKPNTEVFKEYLDIDEKGSLDVTDHTLSNVEGVFVAGDVHDHRYRQAVTAAGDGTWSADFGTAGHDIQFGDLAAGIVADAASLIALRGRSRRLLLNLVDNGRFDGMRRDPGQEYFQLKCENKIVINPGDTIPLKATAKE